MVKPTVWNRLLAVGTRLVPGGQARELTAHVVAQGRQIGDQLGVLLGEFIEMSRQRTNEASRIVRAEVAHQLGGFGLVTKSDLAAFELRMRATSAPKTNQPARKAPRRATK